MEIPEEDLLYFNQLRDYSLFKIHIVDNKNINLSLSNKVFFSILNYKNSKYKFNKLLKNYKLRILQQEKLSIMR